MHEFGEVVELVYTTDLKSLSAPVEMPGVELLKFGETLTGHADCNPEPSPALRDKFPGRCRD